MHSVLPPVICIVSHIFVLSLLSVRRWQLSRSNGSSTARPVPPSLIALMGILVATGTLALPYAGPTDLFQQCGIRIVCYFYAFKLLDLTLTKADDPPKLLDASGEDELLSLERVRYVWLLLTEMRYHAFNIKSVQKTRPAVDSQGEWAHRLLAPVLIAGLVYLFPTAETKCMLLLCFIQTSLEGLHTLLHPRCPNSLFYRPFAAATLGDFWTIHWHSSAVFLQSLAYKPGRKLVGRWFGVVAAFAMSGVWHGWAAMPLVDDEQSLWLGLRVCVFFVMLGVGTLIERLVWQGKQDGLLQRVLVWAWSLAWAGWCFGKLACHSKLPSVKSEHCAR